MEKELIMLTHHVYVGNTSPEIAKNKLAEYRDLIALQTKDDPQYRFKHFILPVNDIGEQKVECIFPVKQGPMGPTGPMGAMGLPGNSDIETF